MVPRKVWKLVRTVECDDVYQFLGVDRNASWEVLREAAAKKYTSIHNQSARTDWARAGATLAGLCRSHIFNDARSKREYDRELLARTGADRAERPRPSEPGGGRRRVEQRKRHASRPSGPDEWRRRGQQRKRPAPRRAEPDGRRPFAVAVLAVATLGVVALAANGIGTLLSRFEMGPTESGSGRSAESTGAMAMSEAGVGEGSRSAASAVEGSLGLDQSDRRRIQAGLSAEGYPPGPADGVFGSATRDAVRRWQTARGFRATGYLNAMEARELRQLGAGDVPGSSDADDRSDGRLRRGGRGPREAPLTQNRENPAVQHSGGKLTVRSAPESRIEMDGTDVGATGATGMLVLSQVQPGRHIVVARKEGHTEARAVVEVLDGRAEIVELALAALPGRLTVTANVEGVLLRIANAGEHRLPLSELEVPAGPHRVTASRNGYRTVVQDVQIRPSALTKLDLVLEPVPVQALLQEASAHFAAGKYREAEAGARSVASIRPDAGAAYRLLGMALYQRGEFEESVDPLSQAIRLGDEIVLSAKHRHRGAGFRAGFCSGTITLSRTRVAYSSDQSRSHGFSVAPEKITGVQVTESSRRAAIRVNAAVNDTEQGIRRRNFDFVHRNTQRTREEPESPFMVLTCRYCDRSLNVQVALMNYASRLAR